MTTTSKFLKSVKNHREGKIAEKFRGNLEDYLSLLEVNPDIAVLAHKRLYKQIMSRGMTTLEEGNVRCNKLFNGEPVKVYDYFSSQFFGMERPLSRVARFAKSRFIWFLVPYEKNLPKCIILRSRAISVPFADTA